MTRSNAPDFYRRVTEFGEPAGALRDVNPLPAGVEDIRQDPELPLWPGSIRKPGPRGQGPGSGTRLLERGREPGL